MPFTFNGIGTRYCGTSNRSARVGQCDSCKRTTTLASYDTREFFCFVYIPLIPMTKYRILDYCSSCRRHRRLPAKEFQAQLDEKVAPLREAARRSPQDPEPRLTLVRTLIAWDMRPLAERELEDATRQFPQNGQFLVLLAQLTSERNDFARALTLYERAVQLDPIDPVATYGQGWVLHQMQRYEEAIPVLQRAVSQNHNKAGALYLLGSSQMKCSRWVEANHSFQQLLALVPAYNDDKKLLRLIRDCKQHLGYQLTDAERKAGRSWWPFGRFGKRPKLQSGPVMVRPALKYAGLALLVLIIPVMLYVAWDRRTNIEVYFDNGLDRAVNVEVDGRKFALPRRSPQKETLNEGSHTVIVREIGGKELERTTFKVEELSILDSIWHDRFFVYDVGAQNVYRRATHGYASNKDDSTYSEELVGMQKVVEQRDVDYPFQGPPDSISVDAGSSVVKKISFNTAGDIDLSTYALLRLRDGKKEEARAAIARAVTNVPCDSRARLRQVQVAEMLDSPSVAAELAHTWIGDCPADDLVAHRTYQDVKRLDGREAELRGEYQKMLAAAPQSARAHYLYGRVLSEPARAADEFQQAIRLDSSLVWPHFGLGHSYMEMERDSDAMSEFAIVLDMKGHDPSASLYYAMAAIAGGDPQAAVARIETEQKARPDDVSSLEARWLLALAGRDWDVAARLQKTLAPADGPDGAWWRKAKLMRIKGDPGIDEEMERAARDKELKGLVAQVRAARLIELGRFTESAETIAAAGQAIDPATAAILRAYAGGGLLLEGDTGHAKSVIDGAATQLAAAPASPAQRVAAAVIGGLRGTMPLEEVMTVTRENNVLAHGWFVTAVRAAAANNRTAAVAALGHCARAAADLDFPYLEAKALAARESHRAGS
jgi:tetratricopeptide (TPR) repeat protein